VRQREGACPHVQSSLNVCSALVGGAVRGAEGPRGLTHPAGRPWVAGARREQARLEIPFFVLAIKRTRSLKEVRVASRRCSWSALCAVRGPRGKREYTVRHAARSETRGCVSGSSRAITCESGAFLKEGSAFIFSIGRPRICSFRFAASVFPSRAEAGAATVAAR